MRRTTLLTVLLAPALAAAQAPADALALYTRADKGLCIMCHQLPQGVGPATRADLGPRLEGTRMRELGRDRIREAIVDPMSANPDTVMPPYGRHRILEDAEIDRLTEFLHALP
jgi:L-cysteine S-thiosulfotransferase